MVPNNYILYNYGGCMPICMCRQHALASASSACIALVSSSRANIALFLFLFLYIHGDIYVLHDGYEHVNDVTSQSHHRLTIDDAEYLLICTTTLYKVKPSHHGCVIVRHSSRWAVISHDWFSPCTMRYSAIHLSLLPSVTMRRHPHPTRS